MLLGHLYLTVIGRVPTVVSVRTSQHYVDLRRQMSIVETTQQVSYQRKIVHYFLGGGINVRRKAYLVQANDHFGNHYEAKSRGI